MLIFSLSCASATLKPKIITYTENVSEVSLVLFNLVYNLLLNYFRLNTQFLVFLYVS